MLRNFKVILVVLVVLVLAGGAYAFANSNTLPSSMIAGDSKVLVSGVGITGVKYTMDATDQVTLNQVSFLVSDATPTTKIEIMLDASAPYWYPCTAGTDSTDPWTCDTTGHTILMANVRQLRVAAHDNASFSTSPTSIP
jgi:hypothetical protein